MLRSLALVSTFAFLAIAAACGDDFESAGGAGTGGSTGGAAGTAGTGGAAGTAGTGGATGGMAGTAGTGGGGTGGATGGTGGTTGGTGGGGTGGGGTGGTAGNAGSAGTGGGPTCTGTFGGIQLMGTPESDSAWDVATDADGYVYVVGSTRGSLHNQNHQGASDAYIMQLDSTGTRQWTQQLGTPMDDFGTAIDVGANVYVVGNTEGAIDGQSNEGMADAFLTAYSKGGAKQWTRAFGSIDQDEPKDLVVDGQGRIFVIGETAGSIDGQTQSGQGDMFFVPFDPAGNRTTAMLLGTPERDTPWGITLSATGSLLIAGESWGEFDGNTNAGNADIVVMNLNADASTLWSHQFGGTTYDRGKAIAVSPQGIYVAAYTGSNLGGQVNQGGADLALIRYTASGAREWTKLVGTTADERVYSMAIDPSGNVYLAGESAADFGGQANQGGRDALVAKFDADGNLLWSVLAGTSENDEANGIAVDKNGCVYVVGYSVGDLGGNANAGSYDLFVLSLDSEGNIR